MARMTANDMMGQFGGHVRNGAPKQWEPGEVPAKDPFNVKGDAGIPTGKNGDGSGMGSAMDGSCY